MSDTMSSSPPEPNAAINAEIAAPVGTPTKARWTPETLLHVHRWTETLLSFRISRPEAFRFTPGHYARVGLGSDADDIEWRPLSVVSSPAEGHLEFFAALVPNGAFSQRLAPLAPGAPVFLEKASYGFLTLDQLAPGRELWLLASGTGLGPFISILRDKHVWTAFERLLVVHSVRRSGELAYGDELRQLAADLSTTDHCPRFDYVPVVTREPCTGALSERITHLIENGRMEELCGLRLSKENSRLMVCGNPELVKDMRALLSARGFQAGRRGAPGQMAFEKYW